MPQTKKKWDGCEKIKQIHIHMCKCFPLQARTIFWKDTQEIQIWLRAQRGRLNVPVLRAVWFSVLACVPGTLHQGQKTSEKNQGDGFPYAGYLLIPQYFPSP